MKRNICILVIALFLLIAAISEAMIYNHCKEPIPKNGAQNIVIGSDCDVLFCGGGRCGEKNGMAGGEEVVESGKEILTKYQLHGRMILRKSTKDLRRKKE